MQKFVIFLQRLFFIAILLLPGIFLQVLSKNPTVVEWIDFLTQYLAIYALGLLTLKIISIVYPPLPGVAFTVASIPIIGWSLSYAIDILGGFLGASLAFFLGKKYGYYILDKALGKKVADKIVSIKIKSKRQVEAAIFLRFAAGGVLSDGLAWGASLIGFRYRYFITGYLISHVLIALPLFYLVSHPSSLSYLPIILIITALAWYVIIKYKKRYLEKDWENS